MFSLSKCSDLNSLCSSPFLPLTDMKVFSSRGFKNHLARATVYATQSTNYRRAGQKTHAISQVPVQDGHLKISLEASPRLQTSQPLTVSNPPTTTTTTPQAPPPLCWVPTTQCASIWKCLAVWQRRLSLAAAAWYNLL